MCQPVPFLRHPKEVSRTLRLRALQVLTPMQDARLLVEAYPLPPDPLLLSKLVAEELCDPCADCPAIEADPFSARLNLPAANNLLPGLAPALPSLEFPPLPGVLPATLGRCCSARSRGFKDLQLACVGALVLV